MDNTPAPEIGPIYKYNPQVEEYVIPTDTQTATFVLPNDYGILMVQRGGTYICTIKWFPFPDFPERLQSMDLPGTIQGMRRVYVLTSREDVDTLLDSLADQPSAS